LFKRILIANRGEIAIRIIRACRELRIPTVAVYSQADADALHVRMADQAVCIGPAPNRDSYLHIPNIITAALITEADAIHPGYGNLSEISAFAENCEVCKLKFIGPSAEVIEKMQNKAEAKRVMKEAGVPVVPGTEGKAWSEQDALRAVRGFGYPLMIKAAAGGGGRGIRVVHSDEDLRKELVIAQREAEAAFGRPEVYFEKYIEEPRHIEFQILADEHGSIVHLGERDCSIQTSRHQKLIEEAPAVGISPGLRARMGEAAVRAAKATGYTNAGTVEFLLDRDRRFYFLEMNTRIQVEHAVTEMITGLDLVKQQIRIASGERLAISQRSLEFRGHAIECRITAEDPDRHFVASGGTVEAFIPPGGPGVRLDTHLYAGYRVPTFYDPLLGKLVVWGEDRREAITRADRALSEFVIRGLHTTIPFHRKILANAFFRRGEYNLNFLRRRVMNED